MSAWRQVVGLRNGYQTALVMSGVSTKIHAKRLAQATEVVLELKAAGVCRPPEAGVPHTLATALEPWCNCRVSSYNGLMILHGCPQRRHTVFYILLSR